MPIHIRRQFDVTMRSRVDGQVVRFAADDAEINHDLHHEYEHGSVVESRIIASRMTFHGIENLSHEHPPANTQPMTGPDYM